MWFTGGLLCACRIRKLAATLSALATSNHRRKETTIVVERVIERPTTSQIECVAIPEDSGHFFSRQPDCKMTIVPGNHVNRTTVSFKQPRSCPDVFERIRQSNEIIRLTRFLNRKRITAEIHPWNVVRAAKFPNHIGIVKICCVDSHRKKGVHICQSGIPTGVRPFAVRDNIPTQGDPLINKACCDHFFSCRSRAPLIAALRNTRQREHVAVIRNPVSLRVGVVPFSADSPTC